MAINYSNPADIFGLQKQNVGVRAASPQNNLQPTPNTLGKGFVEPYQPTPTVKSTSGGTGSQFNISTPSGPSYAPPPQAGSAEGGGINYQMTPAEASGGAVGIAAYNARIASSRGTAIPPPVSPINPPPPQTGATGTGTTPTNYPAPQTFDPNQQGLYGALIAQLANRAQQPSPDYTAAQQQAQQYNQALQQSRANEAQGLAANAQNPIPLEFQQGRGQVLQSQYAQEQAALGAGFQGAANLLGQANVQQGLQQTGLGTAIGATAPQPSTALGFFNPITGQFTQYGGGQGGGAFNAGQVTGNIGIGEQYAQMNAANTAAKGYEDTITNYLKQNPGLNPSDLTLVNSIAQWLQGGQLGDPKYQTLANYINEYANTLAPILGAGGSMTDFKTGLAQSLVNGRANGQSIIEVMRNISKAADDKLANIKSAGQGGGQVAGGSSGYNPSTNTGGNTFGSFFSK